MFKCTKKTNSSEQYPEVSDLTLPGGLSVALW